MQFRSLLELYSLLLERVQLECQLGICWELRTMYIDNMMNTKEYCTIRDHFRSIQPPPGKDINEYYWEVGEKEPRVEFLMQIIQSLQ